MRKRLLSTIIALLFIASLTSVAAAVDYTLYDGVINLGGHIMDDTAYYVECLFETAQGEIIRALEYIGFGAARSMQNVLPKSGQYLLFLSESMGYSYLVDPELSLQHVVNGEVVWNPAAQAALDLPATRMDVASLTQ